MEYQNIARKPPTRYSRETPPISIADARAEPPEQQLFEVEDEPAPVRRFTISTTVAWRGRQLTIDSEGYTADEFCDLLDKRFGPPQVTQSPAAAPASAPICPVHQGRAMKPMQRPDKQGHTHMCTAKVGEGWCDQRA